MANWHANLKRQMEALKKPLVKRLAEVEAEGEQLRTMIANFGGGWVGNRSTPKGKTTKKAGGKKRRIRRTPEQLKAEATKVMAFIRSAGKDGVSGGEIRKKFPGVGQNVKGFVKQYTGESVRTTGQKVKMKYFGS